MRNDVISAPMRGDSLQYDSQSFPLLSANGNGSTASNNRFGLSMQQIRDDDFSMQTEDFPALPGSHVDRNSQKLDERGYLGMGGGQQNDRLRELSQDSLLQQQQQSLLQQQMRMGGLGQGQGQGQGQSLGPTISRGSQHSATVGGGGDRQGLGQGSSNSLGSGGAFLGLGAGGMGMGAMGGAAAGMGLLSLGQSNGNGNGNGNGTLSSAALSMSAEGRFGLAGLLDVIRMTDKVGMSQYSISHHIALHRITAQHSTVALILHV